MYYLETRIDYGKSVNHRVARFFRLTGERNYNKTKCEVEVLREEVLENSLLKVQVDVLGINKSLVTLPNKSLDGLEKVWIPTSNLIQKQPV